MSISDVSSPSVSQLYQQQRRPHGPGKEIREGIDTLKKALESNDLEAAQKAYDSLSEAAGKRQGSTSSTSGTSSKDPLSTMLSEVGTALKTGDISQVQQAFAASGPPQGGPGGAGGRGGPPPGPPPGGQGPSDEVKDAMGQLAQSLSSGDLSGAQSAYDALNSLFEDGSDSNSSSSSSSSSTSSVTSTSSTAATSPADRFKELLGDLGSALQTGHMASAQSLFAAMAPRGSQGIDIMA